MRERTDTGTVGGDGDPPPRAARGFFRTVPGTIVLALVLALLIKAFLVQAFVIPSGSMLPTLRDGDRILVNRLAYRLGDIHRGEVVVFRDPRVDPDRGIVSSAWHWVVDGLGVGSDEFFVKRVIGLPGETIEQRRGVIFVDGRRLAEPWLAPHEDTRTMGPWTVPDGYLMVLGDNRDDSTDSRFAPPGGLGMVPVGNVVGRVSLRIWPPNRLGGLPTTPEP